MKNEQSRYDYFLIWGNGLKHREGIIDLIRKDPSFQILKIIDYKIPNIKRFVKEVYSHDYAPYEHLKGKTKYLLSTSPQVIFIFVKNNNIDEGYFGESEHLHIESKTVKKLKELIRNTYNERLEDRRSENHVIHATDNEIQTQYMLRYLGYPEGTDLFEPYSTILPIYRLETSGVSTIKKIPMDSLYCSLLSTDPKQRTIITEIGNSPHYKYVQGDTKAYTEYLDAFQGTYLQDDHSIKEFESLKNTFHYLDTDHPTDYIMVKKLDSGYLILDGLHRAALLKNSGLTALTAAILE